jgi:hypothetical protein
MPLVAHHPGAEAAFEEMAAAAVAAVEELCVTPVEPLHPGRELSGRRRDHDVVVRIHEAMRVDDPAELLGDDREQAQKVESVDIFAKDRGGSDPVGRHVEGAVREIAAKQPRHRSTVARPGTALAFCARIGTQLTRWRIRPAPDPAPARAALGPDQGLTPA